VLSLLKKIIPPIIAGFILLVLIFRGQSHRVSRGFYYWRSTFALTSEDREAFKLLRVQRLYVKFFEVVWDQKGSQPTPISISHFISSFPEGISIIPTVFITNETLKKLPDNQVKFLANRIHQKITHMANSAGLQIEEIQLDCDWTDETRDKYFQFLQYFYTIVADKINLSATIRLHQIKYQVRTGVPPVDSGALMIYNLEHPGNLDVANAIFDLKTSLDYLKTVDAYPLPLDIALPIFSWGAVFQGSRFVGLINNLNSESLNKNPRFKLIGSTRFQALENVYLQGSYVYKNDLIRIDHSPISEIAKVGRYLARKIKKREIRVILFHWNSGQFNEINREAMEKLYLSLR
jgi:hypothetical protein